MSGPGTVGGTPDSLDSPDSPDTPSNSRTRSRVTTHVLDAALGRPARGVTVRLERRVTTGSAASGSVAAWTSVAESTTDDDGRAGSLGPVDLGVGVYRVVFDTGAYFTATDQEGFYPDVVVSFFLRDPAAHHHVPLLLSPYAYSTYRGS